MSLKNLELMGEDLAMKQQFARVSDREGCLEYEFIPCHPSILVS